MHDFYLFLTPILTLLVVALVGFVGCDALFGLDHIDITETPANFTATAGNMTVTLSWDAVAGATSYKVYIGTVSKTYSDSHELTGSELATSYVWPNLMNNQTFYFAVTATGPHGESSKSDEQSATPSLQGIVTAFITSKTLGTTRNDFNGWVGIRFTLQVDILALSLGRIYVAGNTGSHMVKFVDGASKADVPGTLVSVNPNVGTVDEFTYTDLPAPVQLFAGRQYYLVTQEQLNGDLFYNENTAVTATNITMAVFPVFGTNAGAYTEGPTMGYEYGPVDFKYSVA